MTPDEIITITAGHFKVDREGIIAIKTKGRVYANIKHIAMYLCCFNTDYSLKLIGTHFKDTHHSNIICAREKIENAITRPCDTRDHVIHIQSLINKNKISELPLYAMNEYDELFKAYAAEKSKNRRLQRELDEIKGKKLSVA